MTIEYTSDDSIVRALQGGLSVADSAIIDGDDSDDTAEAYDLLQTALSRQTSIEAAPDLLAALEAITDCYGLGLSPEQFCFRVEEFMLEGRAAIARAKGG